MSSEFGNRPTHEDLTGYALGALDAEETAQIEACLEQDESIRAELAEIERTFGVLDATPELQPLPAMWRNIEANVSAEPVKAPLTGTPVIGRFWMPAAAAALIAAAFLWPHSETPRAGTAEPSIAFGKIARGTDGMFTNAGGIARMTAGDGVVITMDTTTSVTFPAPERLALRAGLVFLDVEPGRRGYTVEAGDVIVETTGTAFSVRTNATVTTVAVESGSVVCRVGERSTTVGAGELWTSASGKAKSPLNPRAFFQRPTLSAELLTRDSIRVVVRNDMPDPITLAPPTAGEPLFLVSAGGHTVPLTPKPNHPLARSVTLAPGEEHTAVFKLPVEAKSTHVAYPAFGLRTEVR